LYNFVKIFHFFIILEESDRFTAFLKLKEKTDDRNSPARQGFDGLLIAPVQRLPRYVMIWDFLLFNFTK